MHCKHILAIYPKCLEGYRLYAQSSLSLKNLNEAEEGFSFVLSSVPDDFLSHFHFAQIKAARNNLESAIWHAERAFEVQASNPDVQELLKSLYRQRDGAEPARIQLTRGALARMYARGDLYQEAINEIRSTLTSAPYRVDLRVLLASLYHQTGQSLSAIEQCSFLLEEYPFCFEANRILAQLLINTSKLEEAEVFQQRLISLEPYYQFVSRTRIDPQDVPDEKIMVELLNTPGLSAETNVDEMTMKVPLVDDEKQIIPPGMMISSTDKTRVISARSLDLNSLNAGLSPSPALPAWFNPDEMESDAENHDGAGFRNENGWVVEELPPLTVNEPASEIQASSPTALDSKEMADENALFTDVQSELPALHPAEDSIPDWLEELSRVESDAADDELQFYPDGQPVNNDVTRIHQIVTARFLPPADQPQAADDPDEKAINFSDRWTSLNGNQLLADSDDDLPEWLNDMIENNNNGVPTRAVTVDQEPQTIPSAINTYPENFIMPNTIDQGKVYIPSNLEKTVKVASYDDDAAEDLYENSDHEAQQNQQIAAINPPEELQWLHSNAANLSDLIDKMRSYLKQNPEATDGWKMLGDALMRNNQVAEALDAYQHSLLNIS